jgi:hypothetical protein
MDRRHCLRKADEFLHAAELCCHDFKESSGWLLLADFWASLAPRLNHASTSGLSKNYILLGDQLRRRLNLVADTI